MKKLILIITILNLTSAFAQKETKESCIKDYYVTADVIDNFLNKHSSTSTNCLDIFSADFCTGTDEGVRTVMLDMIKRRCTRLYKE